jgi:hypothetical protein
MPFLLWLGTLATVCWMVFANGWPPGGGIAHLWHQWEFLAAASAGAYNLLVFPVVFYGFGDRGLDATLERGFAKLLVFWFRFLLPALLLAGVCVLLWQAGHAGEVSPPDAVRLKLELTLGAFASLLLGDLVMLSGVLRGREEHYGQAEALAKQIKHHLQFFDIPFVLSFFVLLRIYTTAGAGVAGEHEAHLQAFVGGASALEMLLQSTMHSFSTLGSPE